MGCFIKKKVKKANNKKNTIIKYVAFNPNYVCWVLGFVFSLWGIIYLYVQEKVFSWILVLFFLCFVLALCVDGVYYIFTNNEIFLVHFWGYKWRLPWLYVTSITKYDFWDSITLRELMGYVVYYDQPYKGSLIRETLFLALTPMVKKCLNKFYRGEITFETKRRKKKK